MSTELPRVNVLLVDDRADNLMALEESLASLGQRLVRAQSGNEALRAVLDDRFAVILMDIRMPGLDGFETIALLKQRERTRHVPIIFLSAYPEPHHRLRSYSAGAVDYILKPFDPDELRSKVQVFVNLRQNELALEAAQRELESRVAERTAELEREIVVRKAAEQRLMDLAHHDPLTGLANRRLLIERLAFVIAQSRRRPQPTFALLLLDIDHFKRVNDTQGHLAGDELLVGIARRLQSCLREVDTAARLGGDEIAILLDGINDLADAQRTVERIQAALSEPFVIGGRVLLATASIGIALMRPEYVRGDELLRDADIAMYRAKDAGRASYRIFGEPDSPAHRRPSRPMPALERPPTSPDAESEAAAGDTAAAVAVARNH
jgi:diguanylate cyclase (GGDEF)-like protein